MQLKLDNSQDNIVSFMRSCSYTLLDRGAGDEWNFVRRLSGRDYPRFHCYLKIDDQDVLLNLHLDQKAPSYPGSARHSGEYDSPIVEAEAERILQIFGTK